LYWLTMPVLARGIYFDVNCREIGLDETSG
jgi:hypothetical protein